MDGTPLPEPLRRVLDAASDGQTIVEAIPDYRLLRLVESK